MNVNHPITIYLMRHGQTAYNVDDRLRGRADLELTDTGRAQADALGRLFAGLALSRVVSSPLRRAVDTASPVASAAGLKVEPDDAFNDRDYGEWTGASRSDVIQRFGSIDAAPGVESWQTLCDRVSSAFDSLLASSHGPAVVLVGHDASNRALLATLIPTLGQRPGDIPQANGCWNRLEWKDDGWTLTVLNASPGDGQCP